MSETPPDALSPEPTEYDPVAAERLAGWVHNLLHHAGERRKLQTNEDRWDADWNFLSRQKQWENPSSLPNYRRAIIFNVWRRAYHMTLATILGNRPLLKLVPEGPLDPEVFETWQAALWAAVKTQDVISEYTDACSWAWVGDGGILKLGFGRDGDDLPDVQVKSQHPKKFYPDPECTDPTLKYCAYVLFRDVLDLSTITSRYSEQGWRVKPETGVSMKWADDRPPAWADTGVNTIAPAGGWATSRDYRRARATVVECWIDDPSLELVSTPVPIVDPLTQEVLGHRTESKWEKKYPFGRLITCTKDVVLRDIPNPYGRAFGWARRWPFVFVEGAMQPHVLWRPGLLADLAELNRSSNKSLSLLMENMLKINAAIVIADTDAMDDEDWDLLAIVPGAKIRKNRGSEVKLESPKELPASAFTLPDYFARKLEEVVGLHDPPIAPGQAVAAKTVSFLMAKGSFLMGMLARLGEEALERVGVRMVGLMQARYLPGRKIPLFAGQTLQALQSLPELPPALRFRVEASSALTELMATMAEIAQAEALMRKKTGGK